MGELGEVPAPDRHPAARIILGDPITKIRPRDHVMLRELRDWVSSLFSPSAPPTREQDQDAAQEKRENRARSVTSLQTEVRRLQQDVTDLTALCGDGTAGKERPVDRAQLVFLEKQLEQKQQELGRSQGRV